MSRIVQVANFVGPHSGGIRTVLEHLARGYVAAGHEVIQIVPGESAGELSTAWGRRIALRGRSLPGTGYRVLWPGAVRPVAARLAPDRLEVHDRSTLRGLGRWAARRGLPATVISHERLDRLLAQWLPSARGTERAADYSNAKLAAGFDTVICTTAWAAEEFARLSTGNLRRVPLGVDLTRFTPSAAAPAWRARLAADDETLVVMASRLSREKHPALAIETVAELTRRGHRVRLVVAGDGPLRRQLHAQAAGLPVRFVGHLDGAGNVAALLATADLVLAPGPIETFGLAALEALASGTPVIADASSALPEILGEDGGLAVDGDPSAFADAALTLLDRPPPHRRAAARRRAEGYDWSITVAGFLAAHGLAGLERRVG